MNLVLAVLPALALLALLSFATEPLLYFLCSFATDGQIPRFYAACERCIFLVFDCFLAPLSPKHCLSVTARGDLMAKQRSRLRCAVADTTLGCACGKVSGSLACLHFLLVWFLVNQTCLPCPHAWARAATPRRRCAMARFQVRMMAAVLEGQALLRKKVQLSLSR